MRTGTLRGETAVLVARGAMGGIALFAAFVLVHAWNRPARPPAAPGSRESGRDLEAGRLVFPVPAVSATALSDSFEEARGKRSHLAIDIPAPRGSPVVAVDDGTLARLSSSVTAGIFLYLLDDADRYCFFYAHLQGYAEGLAEGQRVQRGEVIGYVGTTGNAPKNTPHLHFAIQAMTVPKQCWSGLPLNPYPFLLTVPGQGGHDSPLSWRTSRLGSSSGP